MSDSEPKQWIVATKEARTLPVVDLLTGRGFITGKSGSGKSNSASVIAEELLENNYNLLVVDTDGEYFGMKERFELLHVGRGPECDVEVGPEHAEKLARIALDENVPIILDVSDYLDGDEAEALVENVVEQLFVLEGDRRKPFLLVVEEMQEYLPQSGGKDDLADLLLRVAKRGRKRGLGLCGISQRPSAVDKDFITQADWMVWHRLTWPNDVDVVRDILGESVADEIADLADGEGYLVTDWDESVERVQFRRKKTFDAGATPGLEEYDRPDLKAVGPDLIRELTGEADEYRPLESVRPGATDDGSADDGPVPGDLEIDLEELLGGRDEEERPVESIDDPEELRELLEVERKRNRILEDEVRELKSIIRETEKRTRLEAVRSGTDDDADTLFEEPRREGTGGMLVEASLLLSYLLFGTVRRLRRLTGRLDPGRGSPGEAYPITTRRDEAAARLRRVVITLVVVAAGLAALLLVWLW